MILFSFADFLQNKVFTNKPLEITIRVSNSLDPDQDQRSVGFHLGSNCLQKVMTGDNILHWHSKSYNR